MSPFAIQLIKGFKESDLEKEDINSFKILKDMGAIENIDGIWRLKSLYRVGELYINKQGKGFVEASSKEQKDLLIEPNNMGDANVGDEVVVKRVIARRGRASAKVKLTICRSHLFNIVYTNINSSGFFETLNIKTALPTKAIMRGVDLKIFKIGTVMKVDALTDEVLEVFGHLKDPKVDEKISLALFNRPDKFDKESIAQAKEIESEVRVEEYPNRVDLRDLDFCTIDPTTAKDFDDAIYFDIKNYILYVAIADVSAYIDYFTPIDQEAKRRGFTTYFPHKSFPMLPRELSENICSLKPDVDRLAFVVKIELDKSSLNPIKEEFFEAIINSKRRFNYIEIDTILENGGKYITRESEKRILKYLLPLYQITKRLRERRLKNGFDFRTQEVKLSIDSEHNLIKTQIEMSTPSHSLIEECMLLANRASAKRFEYGIFRVHLPPQLTKLEELLNELATIGLFVKEYHDAPSLIRAIQKEAKSMDIANEVDSMIIKSLKQATYSANNNGHFGLGFSHYSHFTSPIRRYSDLILHRLIKAQLKNDKEQMEYLLRNIEPLSARVSELEREVTKAEWDFRDRKLCRWAESKKGIEFNAEVIETGDSAKAIINSNDINGVVVNIKGDNLMLFDKIKLIITEVDIASATIMGNVI
jgi:ribonuclease R